ncbi:hypothetical protein HGRIS_001906 [Hohenbuehelia grisea]|uniref:Aminotransferase class V domain-containing protein n=1 Tax=Hohenbuehelia grisea TaxID=104357 RepID=A0ABR3JJZ9_9AGAR
MGNSHSSKQTHAQQQRTLIRQRSAPAFSRISLGCTSGNDSVLSSDPSRESFSLVNEKVAWRDREKLLLDRGDQPARHHLTPSPQIHYSLAYAPITEFPQGDTSPAYHDFIRAYPEYQLTWILDTLRRTDYSRLERTGETYVDYMGGALYPESLIRVHTTFLNQHILGNTHSVSNSSQLSASCAAEAREAVLAFFRAPPEYTVVFTANATAALKLIGEAYPFANGSSYVLGADSHNSVHGIREYASNRGARICYIPSTQTGGFDAPTAKHILLRNRPRSRDAAPCLFAMTGQSNISNAKNPLSTLEYAQSLGYHTLLDAAALAPTSVFSLAETPVDAMAVSFYKMFGFPTGVGALVVKKTFLEKLQRPWFAGGNVDVVQVPGTIVTRSHELYERFEDGTINYLTLPAVVDGLRFLSAYLPFLPLRLSSLLHYLTSRLSQLRHDTTGTPVVRILSRLPVRRPKSVGEQADCGSIVSLIFLTPSGDMLPNSFIEYAASKESVSLRTGCMCNPGGAAAILDIEDDMKQLYPGVTLKDFEHVVGRELGVVRISMGLASNFQDVEKVLQFASSVGTEKTRQVLWTRWTEASGTSVGQAL